jgi:peptidoglycan/xylan/chitin deacetylase (PgdA/CDA1 family)
MLWILAAGILAVSLGALAYGLGSPGATLLGPALVRGPEGPGAPRRVMLTFDDGPSDPFTGQILDILRKTHVKATFFICGASAERYPDLVRRIQAEGHEIGNHTYSHPYLCLKTRACIAGEIDRTQDILEKITGRRPSLFRPPFGVKWFSLWGILKERSLTMVLWSVRGYDGQLDSRGITKLTLEQIHPGAIIVLHDGFEAKEPALVDRSATVRALPAIIEGIKKAGYTFGAIGG